MHKRYTSKQIQDIWSEKNKYQLWFDIELAVCEAHAKYRNIPEEAVEEIKKGKWGCVGTGNFVEKIDELGGAISAIEQEFQQNEISSSAFDYQKSIDESEKQNYF